MHCVIGSGPAGVACAKALLARGANVLMLDAGLQLEPERAGIVHTMAAQKPTDWTAQNHATIHGNLLAGANGIPLKLLFGSDFSYRETAEKIPWRGQGIGFRPSLALGGFSNVWGAAMLPYRDQDISDWPIGSKELAPHYQAVTQFTGLAAQSDDLAEWFPLAAQNPGTLQASRQAQSFLGRLQTHRARLRERGWRFGRARVAVNAEKCVYCRECMSGCVYGAIYNSADTVNELRHDKKFSYQRDVIVTCLREESGKVSIEGFHRETRMALKFEAARVYLAAGTIPTAQILLRSENAYEHPLTLRDSQYFLFPLLLARRTPDVQREALYTLSQLFIELDNLQIAKYGVHLQLYTHSDVIGQALRKSLGPLKFLARPLEERMFIVQGYLHSDESSTITMTLKRDGKKDFLQLDAQTNPETRRTVKRVVRELLKQSRRLGGVAVPPMLQIAEPGRGFHSGGSFPMRSEPKPFESDVLGRPHGWSRVHVVDASALPSIPATTITFSVMANAHRIGWETAAS